MEFPDRYRDAGISKRDFWKACAKESKLPFLDEISPPTQDTLNRIPNDTLKQCRFIPFDKKDDIYQIVIDDPFDFELRDVLQHVLKTNIEYSLVLPETLDAARDTYLRQ